MGQCSRVYLAGLAPVRDETNTSRRWFGLPCRKRLASLAVSLFSENTDNSDDDGNVADEAIATPATPRMAGHLMALSDGFIPEQGCSART